MRMSAIAAAACAALATAALAGPFDQFKGKMKEGMYEYKMTMDMGAVPGHARRGWASRISRSSAASRPRTSRKAPSARAATARATENCEVKDFKMSGNTATYRMECKGEGQMKADNKITFLPNGFDMDMKMSMVRNGQPMNMTQHMEGRNLGPCK